jgi:hypothetical protein
MKKHSLAKFAVIAFALIFIIHQAISSFYKPITTESAVYYTMSDGFNITGVIIRNEILVKNNDSGVLHFMIDDGKRVSKNGVVANVYDSESASITLSQISRLKSQIADIEDILSYNDLDAANLELINNKIFQNLNELVVSSSYGNYDSVSKNAQALLSSINRKQAAMGQTADFATKLDSLNADLNKLTSTLPNAKKQIMAQESGYFLSKVDGYEQVLTTKSLDEITPDFLNKLKAKSYDEKTVGKIVSDYEWYIAAEVSINDSLNYKVGDSLEIHTSLKSSKILPVTVKKINISESGSKAVVIFACSEMNTELASMRSGPMTVVSKTYSGLKVSRKALRKVDTKTGVYVVSGMQAKFVEVEIVYSNDDFMICMKKDADGNLKLYDQVVVKGKNMYDGKIVG